LNKIVHKAIIGYIYAPSDMIKKCLSSMTSANSGLNKDYNISLQKFRRSVETVFHTRSTGIIYAVSSPVIQKMRTCC